MKEIKRFGVSIEKGLLEFLDEFSRRHGFPNRSQAIRHLIRDKLIKDKWQKNQQVAAALVLVYDHHKHNLLKKSMDIQHNYHQVILAVQHVHINHNSCLEIIALKGKAADLKELADKLISLKGVKHGELVMSAV